MEMARLGWLSLHHSHRSAGLAASDRFLARYGRENGRLSGHRRCLYWFVVFSVGLFFSAIAYLVFVGEPRRGVQRYQWLPYLGWAVFGVCVTAFVITAGWGAITIYIQEQVNSTDQALQRKAATRPLFWHLTDYNKNALAFALDQTPKDKRFVVLIQCLPDATSRTYVKASARASGTSTCCG